MFIEPNFLKANERVVSTIVNNIGGKTFNIGLKGERGVVRQVVTDVLGKPVRVSAEQFLAYFKK